MLSARSYINNFVEVELDKRSVENDFDHLDNEIAVEHLLQSSLFDLKTVFGNVISSVALVVDDCIGRDVDECTKELIGKARNVAYFLRNSNRLTQKIWRKNLLIIDVEIR